MLFILIGRDNVTRHTLQGESLREA
jgi:hypothetical protein